MSGIMGMMDIARRALAAEQLGVEVTSNNIANVNTPGYSRQKVIFETSPAITFPYGPLGYGVSVEGIERAFDPFVTAKLDENTSYLADYKAQKSDLEQVGSLFNETQDGGMNDLLASFWASWGDVSDNPSGSGERQALLSNAQNLTDALNFRANQLVQQRTSITQRINPTMEEINSHAANIANLNKQISETETTEHPANDLRDQRQLELNKLSALLGVSYYTTGNGTINVSLADGTSLVEGENAWQLQAGVTPSDTVSITWHGPGLTKDVTSAITSGQLGGIIKVRDEFIPQYQAELDDIAKELVAAVNTQHSQGVGLELFADTTSSNFINTPDLGAPLVNNPSLAFGDRITAGSFNIHVEDNTGASVVTAINITGATTLNDLVTALNAVPNISASIVTSGGENRLQITADDANHSFGFSQDTSHVLMALGVNTFFKGDSAYTIGVDDTLASNPDLVAAGQIDSITGAHPQGDNRNGLTLADMGNQPVGPSGLTFEDAYRQLVSGIGLDAEQAGNNQTFFQGLVDQFQQLRDSVSGVSLDEELTNLIKYQRSYQAAAKMVTVGDELLQTLLSIKQ